MRWVCPRCRNQVSVALTQCPYCAPDGTERAEPPSLQLGPPQPVASQPHLDRPTSPVAPSPDATSGAAPDDAAPIRAEFRQAAVRKAEEQESAFTRGLKIGVGFMLAVVLILLLIALLMTWFFQEG